MTFEASALEAGQRLDHFLQRALPEFSRSRLQDWIKTAKVRVNGAGRKASYEVRCGDRIEVEPAPPAPLRATAEEIPLEILYEDDDLIAVNKPAGMVVHAGAGVTRGTLVNALLGRFHSLSGVGGELRPGIVHRLDRQTSGVILVAKHDAAHRALQAQFASRKVRKIYLALVHGVVTHDRGEIDSPIARDPVRRTRMTARLGTGRTAHTDYRVEQRFARFTFLKVRIGTGRTHQIRVHLASIGHPVAGDRLYGAPASAGHRFFLHAHRIRILHPTTGGPMEIVAPLPPHLEEWLREVATGLVRPQAGP
ncbi:MAG: RluA family pseudouridine synthase [Bryobacteraceae bacterium]